MDITTSCWIQEHQDGFKYWPLAYLWHFSPVRDWTLTEVGIKSSDPRVSHIHPKRVCQRTSATVNLHCTLQIGLSDDVKNTYL